MSSSLSMDFSEQDYRYCKCGNEALLKTSWTQQNFGRRFFMCKNLKKWNGCDYFDWYEERHSSQANRLIWGLLKKVKSFEDKENRDRRDNIVGIVDTCLLLLGYGH
ncbi:hypothetical protein FXO37_18745 [Capsicum annuum]|nr:hypothetical protein FXO37_18745 [Capsicum annuum]